jgi:hypothetical protein
VLTEHGRPASSCSAFGLLADISPRTVRTDLGVHDEKEGDSVTVDIHVVASAHLSKRDGEASIAEIGCRITSQG